MKGGELREFLHWYSSEEREEEETVLQLENETTNPFRQSLYAV